MQDKELYQQILGLSSPWTVSEVQSATAYFNDWYNRVIHKKLGPLKKVAKTIRERLDNVVSYCAHGITNAVAEGIKIMSIKRRVGGYRNRENCQDSDLLLLWRPESLPTISPDGR